MTKLKRDDQINEIAGKAKSWIEKGNSRHIIVRNEDGSKIIEVNLTVAVIVGIFLFFMPFSWLIIGAAVIYGIVQKLRVEVIRDITVDDEAVEIDLEQ